MSKIVETPKELAKRVNDLRAQMSQMRENGLPVASIKTQILEIQAKIKKAQAAQIEERIKRVSDPRKADARRKIELGGLIIVAGLENEDPAVIVGALVEAANRIWGNDVSDLQRKEHWRALGIDVLSRRAKEAEDRRMLASLKKPRKASAPAVSGLENLGG